jgi:hypothetical protein
MIRRIAAVAATVITGLAVALIAPTGPAQAVPNDGWMRIRNVDTRLALQSVNPTKAGVAIVQDGLANDTAGSPISLQEWQFTIDKGYARFRNAFAKDASGWMALTVNNGVDSLSRPVIQYTNIPGNPAQLWSMVRVGNAAEHVYTLRNPASNRCLSIPNGDPNGGIQPITYPCNGKEDQMWVIWDNN